jgi:ferredoxin/menaquinone-dependent protoporphyrinogen IX oxidase
MLVKILILQFSGTGNTYYIAKKIQNTLKQKGHEVVCYPLEKVDEINDMISNYDMLGIGFPIYGSDMPAIVSEMISQIDVVDQKQVFTFCTQMMYSGDGAIYLAKKLMKKGFIVRQCEHFNMPNNITDYLRFLPGKVNYEKLEKRTDIRVEKFCERINQNKKRLKGNNFFSHFLGLLQRYPYQKMMKSYKPIIYIDDTCILCNKCVKLCPVGNLKLEDSKIVDSGNCILCYRCINNCPANSLHMSKRRTVKKPYKGPTENFNIFDVSKVE